MNAHVGGVVVFELLTLLREGCFVKINIALDNAQLI